LGGKVNWKVDIRKVDPTDPNSMLGFFAVEDIYGSELLMSIPWTTVFTPKVENETDPSNELIDSAFPCETAFRLIEEIEKDDESEFFTYMEYLKNVGGKLPSLWSQAGKELLGIVVNDQPPPDDLMSWVEKEWYEDCKGQKGKEDIALKVISRGWDYVMVPLLDIMNHRNGHYYNTFSDSLMQKTKEAIQVRASRRIKVGEQIYTSYSLCGVDCDNRKEFYGTPEILRDYGFVENYPQRWIFDEVLQFEIRDNSSIESPRKGINYLAPPTSDELVVEWLSDVDELKEEDAAYLTEELERLQELENSLKSNNYEAVPKEELEVILEYHKSLTTALTLAIESIEALEEEQCQDGDESCNGANSPTQEKTEDDHEEL